MDGDSSVARLQHPMGVCCSPMDSNILYIVDTFNHKLKMVDIANRECKTLCGGRAEGTETEKESEINNEKEKGENKNENEKESENKNEKGKRIEGEMGIFNAPEGLTCQIISIRCDGESCRELEEPILRVFIADTGNNAIKVVDIQNRKKGKEKGKEKDMTVRELELVWE